jgi:hypothetical protein
LGSVPDPLCGASVSLSTHAHNRQRQGAGAMVGWYVERRSGSAALGERLDKLDHMTTLSLAGLAARDARHI